MEGTEEVVLWFCLDLWLSLVFFQSPEGATPHHSSFFQDLQTAIAERPTGREDKAPLALLSLRVTLGASEPASSLEPASHLRERRPFPGRRQNVSGSIEPPGCPCASPQTSPILGGSRKPSQVERGSPGPASSNEMCLQSPSQVHVARPMGRQEGM